MKRYIIMLCVFLSVMAVSAQNLQAKYSGKLDMVGLPLVCRFENAEDGTRKCLWDSPNQGASDIPAVISRLTADSIFIDMPVLGAKYEAAIQDDGKTFAGNFKQRGQSIGLTLHAGDLVKPARPQTPKEPYPYQTKEVSVMSKYDSAWLGGTITYPFGYGFTLKPAQVPVVLMVSGSGQQNRDEELFDHKPFLVLADYLAKRGIATLRYDDRGVFKSQGSLEGNTTEVNARDAEGWLDCLRDMQKRGELGSVGILGHSEGGLIAFILAGEGKVDFVVSMAGPATDGKTVSMDQALGIIRLQEEAGQLSFEAAEQQRQQLSEEMVLASIRSQYGDNSWMDYFLKFDPAPSIQKITCPVMALNGMKDFQVDAKHNLGLLRELLPKNDKHLIKEYYGLNHLFQPCRTGLYAEYGQIEITMSEEVMKDIADWILRIK
ncbi:MAG: alpha/beta hydrolase [Bacteroidaceae bacterium]|nr:alpha/beta hydrolase [Bacteroidaceae bacterium]